MPTEFETGFLIGLLVGEGHFGGDGRQPHVTLRMHERHEAMFRWIERTFPGGKLYGPYEHGGRRYYQWMARGRYLREYLFPLLQEHLTPRLDSYARRRLDDMHDRYRRQLESVGTPAAHEDGAAVGEGHRREDPSAVALVQAAPAQDDELEAVSSQRRGPNNAAEGDRSS